ncbi:MAG: hypothetical protein J0H92_10780 [Sphingobacteriales bacterium]|nr:hypothetical protein [Sphingobacteriales bacterium]
MNNTTEEILNGFWPRKVSTEKAIKLLRQGGIQVADQHKITPGRVRSIVLREKVRSQNK